MWAHKLAKRPETFLDELNASASGVARVTEADLRADAEAFMSFAGMMGVQPKIKVAPPRALPSGTNTSVGEE